MVGRGGEAGVSRACWAGGLTNTVTSNLFQPRRGFTESARQAAVTEAGTRAGRMPRGQNSPRAPHTLQVRHRLPGTGAAPSPRSRCPSSCLLASRTPCGLSLWGPCLLGQPDQALGAHRIADVPTATGCPVSPVSLEGTVPRCAGGSGRPPRLRFHHPHPGLPMREHTRGGSQRAVPPRSCAPRSPGALDRSAGLPGPGLSQGQHRPLLHAGSQKGDSKPGGEARRWHAARP